MNFKMKLNLILLITILFSFSLNFQNKLLAQELTPFETHFEKLIISAIEKGSPAGDYQGVYSLLEMNPFLKPANIIKQLIKTSEKNKGQLTLIEFLLKKYENQMVSENQGIELSKEAAAVGNLPVLVLLKEHGGSLQLVEDADWQPAIQSALEHQQGKKFLHFFPVNEQIPLLLENHQEDLAMELTQFFRDQSEQNNTSFDFISLFKKMMSQLDQDRKNEHEDSNDFAGDKRNLEKSIEYLKQHTSHLNYLSYLVDQKLVSPFTSEDKKADLLTLAIEADNVPLAKKLIALPEFDPNFMIEDFSYASEAQDMISHDFAANHDIFRAIVTHPQTNVNQIQNLKFGHTLAMYAVAIGDVEMLKHLMNNGADFGLVDNQGDGPVEWAKLYKTADLMMPFLDFPTEEVVLSYLDKGKIEETLQYLQKLEGQKDFDLKTITERIGTEMDSPDSYQGEPERKAKFKKSSVEFFYQLLLKGKIEIFKPIYKKYNLFDFAIRYKYFDTVKSLLQREDMNLNENYNCIGKTKGNYGMVLLGQTIPWEIRSFVLNHPKFDVNQKSSQGLTPAMIAADQGSEAMLKILVARHADMSIKNDEEQTAGERLFQQNNHRKLYVYLMPELYKKRIQEALENLSKISELDQNEIKCDPGHVMSHIKIVEEKVTQNESDEKDQEQPALKRQKKEHTLNCDICTSVIPERMAYWQLGNCPCKYCFGCALDFKQMYLNHGILKRAVCPVHEVPIPLSFFKAAKATDGELDKFKLKFIQLALAKKDGFRYCKTPDCMNGLVLGKNKDEWFNCQVCERESFLRYDESKDVIPHPKEMARPCPWCLTIFTKDEHCNHVTCGNPECGKKWNFKSGRNDPKGDFDLYDNGARTYRVPGDAKKDGSKYTEYVDGVADENE